MKYLRWFFWFALIASIVMHLVIVLAEPLYLWFTQPEFAQTELRKTERKLVSQNLAEDEEKPAELANVKPAEQQVVYLQSAVVQAPVEKPQPTEKPEVQAKAKPQASAVKAKVVASSVIAKEATTTAANGVEKASAAASIAQEVAKEMLASAPMAASKVSASASRTATQIDQAASQRFPRVVEIGYYWTVFDARMTWKIEQDQYDLQLKANPAGRKIHYQSTGQINARHGVKPSYFGDLSLGIDMPPKNEAAFDWDADTARVGPPNQQKTEPIEPGDQDLLSAGLHLALMGSKHPSYEMSLFSGKKRYPNVVFELKGEATLTLGTTKVDAVLMRAKWSDRQVDFWLAPEWNNLPVKISINLGKDGNSFEVLAKEVTLDGKKVLEWIAPRDQQQRRP